MRTRACFVGVSCLIVAAFAAPAPTASAQSWSPPPRDERCPSKWGADNVPVEVSPNPDPELSTPVHQIMLVINGIHLVERMKLNELAAAGVYEFAFVVQPLKLQGATGSTVAPVAIY